MRNLWVMVFFVMATANGVWRAREAAQKTPQSGPAVGAKLVLVRTGSYAGMCVGYCDHQTTIGPKSIRLVTRAFDDKAKYPDMESKRAITKKDWETLEASIDAKVLAALDVRTGCPGCADEVVNWVEVEFSDGTKKRGAYNAGTEPAAIAELLVKIQNIDKESFAARS